MSINYYLREHVYVGHGLLTPEKFVPLAHDHPARRAFEEDTPYVHVCKAGNGLMWAMDPKDVLSFAKGYGLLSVFEDEAGNHVLGGEFLRKVGEYSEDDWVMMLGKRFC